MLGKIFITRSGYDPLRSRHVKDPFLGDQPSLGACRPDIRRSVKPGDHIFVISGKVREAPQFVMGGFAVDEKMPAAAAYRIFPEQRLRLRSDGQLTGNIIVDAEGRQHTLDQHDSRTFDRRVQDYVVGRDCLALVTPEEIARGREETMDVLREVLEKDGLRPIDLLGRGARNLTDKQVLRMRDWLASLKTTRP